MPVKNPEAMARVWCDAFNAGDVDALVALYEPDAALVRRSGERVTGRDAIRAMFAGSLARQPRIDAVTRKVVVAGDLALVFGDWTLHTTGADGRPVQASARSTEVLRRQADGTWRYLIDDPYS
ncbi:MAG: SgcJ/EcaC family oxidoreductase [Candidatus Rokubacteria bacterium]|nr:SgcJ/EcaC family oxidoreductase [Candidatus Rokubacteria bacterium]